jgi:YidC/Oxa1 family membrane protein insertase
MDQQRPLLFIALALVLFLLWDAWHREYGPQSQPVAEAPAQLTADGVPIPDDVPFTEDSPTARVAPDDVPMAPGRGELLRQGERIEVLTDIFHAEIDTIGGDLRRVQLLQYPISSDRPDEPFMLMNDTLPNLFVSQSGFTAKRDRGDGTLLAAPNHHTRYSVSSQRHVMRDSEDSLSVDLTWQSPEGVVFTKSYVFSRDSYLIDVRHRIDNRAEGTWRGNRYSQLQRTQVSEIDTPRFIYTYMGGVYWSPEDRYKKISFSDMQSEDFSRQVTGGWTAMIQHYFLGAWVPPQDEPQTFYTQYISDNVRYVFGMRQTNEVFVPGGEQLTLSNQLFIGPKLQDRLSEIAPGLDLTVDYGMLHIISKPLFIVLSWIYSFVGNWGWAIVILTILIKLVFYKLSETSYKSMANMRRVQPRMVQLKERYGSDRQKMNQALMELYRKEKINPLGGCLPILVQIPVFIALYWVLLESVELRQAEWILWIKDMSIADPYFILPLIMGATMFIQMKLNPAPMDPIQAKIMMILPFVFTIFFAFFPAGLVLYWVANNILSIAQQWYITRHVVKA